jgi:hypothetical protein
MYRGLTLQFKVFGKLAGTDCRLSCFLQVGKHNSAADF